MTLRRRPVLPFLALVLLWAGTASLAGLPAFHRGVNLTGGLQAPELDSVWPGAVSDQDFADLRALGCDVVRLPVNFGPMAAAHGGRVSPRLFAFLDQALASAVRHGLVLVLDNHSLNDAGSLEPGWLPALPDLWTQIAGHFRTAPDSLVFELLNEPQGVPAADWDRYQRAALAAVRKISPDRTVVVTGADWGGIDGLMALEPSGDPNLLYSFHFYEPFAFTHQGAGWTDQETLTQVPFPPDPARPPVVLPSARRDDLVRRAQAYMAGSPEEEMRSRIARAARWARDRGVRLFCGELGVYDAVSPPQDRVRWYALTRQLLEDQDIPFTSWDYRGGFGLFLPPQPGSAGPGLNLPLVRALGLSPPVPAPRTPALGTRTFPIWGPGPGEEVVPFLAPNGGRAGFEDPGQAPEGAAVLRLAGGSRYASLGFRFQPARDLALLARAQAVLTLWLRAEGPAGPVDLRLVQTPAGGEPPWRASVTLGPDRLPWDGLWHRLGLPLALFAETGAWDGRWHPPEGRFDWARVGQLELVAEHGEFSGRTLRVGGVRLELPRSGAETP